MASAKVGAMEVGVIGVGTCAAHKFEHTFAAPCIGACVSIAAARAGDVETACDGC